jgi:RHS repeat-associated protein
MPAHRWCRSLAVILLFAVVVLGWPTGLMAQVKTGGGGGVHPNTVGNGISVWTAPSVAPNRPTNSGPYPVTFSVENYSSDAIGVAYSCRTTGPVTCDSLSSPGESIPAHTTVTVRLVYMTTSGTGAAQVILDAGQDWVPVGLPLVSSGALQTTVVAGGGKGIPMLVARAVEHLDRGRCLTVGAGEHAGLSCGDLILTEGMPPYRTLGRDRALTLYYNSATATGLTLVPVRFVEPLSIPAPNTIRMVLNAGGYHDSLSFAPPANDCGYVGCVDTFQVAVGKNLAWSSLPTGLHDATVTLRNIYGSSCLCDSSLTTEVLVVNRSASEYGQGWSLLGIEQLLFDSDTTRTVWLGGDGSARVYHRSASLTAGMLTASGLGSFSAAGAVDGSITTAAWSGGSAGAWVKMDLGAPWTVTTLTAYNNGSGTAVYDVQYSDNGSAWRTAFSGFRLVNHWREVTWASAGAHRYWRLYQVTGATGTLSVTELTLGRSNTWYGAPGAAPDSVVYIATDTSAPYRRYLKHGAQVGFGRDGRHHWTLMRTGHRTDIRWRSVAGGKMRIDSILVPPSRLSGRAYTFQWNGTTGLLESITDPAGRVLTATITSGRLVKLTAPGHLDSTRYAYDSRGVLVKRIATRQHGTTRGDSAVTVYTYANNARVTRVEIQADSAGTQFETSTIAAWDDRTIPAPVKADSLGPSTRVDGPIAGTGDAVDVLVGAFGQPTRIAQLGLNAVTRIRYDSSQTLPALPTEVRYPHPTSSGAVGRIVRLSWNERGNLAQQRDSTAHLGTIGGPTDSTTYAYTDPAEPNAPSLIRNGVGGTFQISYNGMGLPGSTTDERGHVTTYTYVAAGTAAGMLAQVRENAVPTWSESAQAVVVENLLHSFAYTNADGNLEFDSLPSGAVTTYLTDTAGAVSDVYDPIGMRRQFVHDALGRVVAESVWTAPQVNPTGNRKLQYCRAAWFDCAMADSTRPVTSGIPSILVTNYTYSPTGLTTVSDPRQVTRGWRYDARGNVVAEIDDYGDTTRARYGVDGLLLAKISRTGDSVAYGYDATGRRTSLAYPSRDASPYGTVEGGTITFAYDKLGHLTSAGTGSSVILRTYNGDGTLASEVSRGLGYDSLGYQYDVLGRRTGRAHQDASGLRDSVRYSYGSAGDLDSLIVRWGGPTGFTTPRVFRYTWDALGRRKTITYPLTGGMTVSYAYDALGVWRRLYVSHPQHSTTSVELADSLIVTRPVVGPTGRILSEQMWCPGSGMPGSPCPVPYPEEAHAFNGLGWLVRQARKHDVSRTVIDSLRYDASGNIVWRRADETEAADSFVIAAHHNRLERVLEAGAGDLHIEYRADGSRRGEWRDTIGTGVADSRWYYYDGLGRTTGIMFIHADLYGAPDTLGAFSSCVHDPLGRQVQPCAQGFSLGLDGESISRIQDWQVANGPGLDDPLVGLFRQSGVTKELYYVTDGQGRHLLATEVGGGLDQSLTNGTYTGWQATGAAGGTAFGADRLTTGQAPGLAFYRNRIYDQATGRWTQEDPLGVAGGLNLYQFNGNDPVSFGDPFGLCPFCFVAGAVVGDEVLTLGLAVILAAATTDLSNQPSHGELVPTFGPRPTSGERQKVNDRGNTEGCMTCGAKTSGTASGNWIPNHVPPTSLKMPGEPQYLGPHCRNCSNKQGGWLRQLLRKVDKFITGGNGPMALPAAGVQVEDNPEPA